MTKLIIQIPCYNEERTILTTLNDLPKTLDGIDSIEVLVIDDGSRDSSAKIAQEWGAKVLSIKPNKGLANAFRSGIQEALRLGADIIVNTDANATKIPIKNFLAFCISLVFKVVAIIIRIIDIINIKMFARNILDNFNILL